MSEIIGDQNQIQTLVEFNQIMATDEISVSQNFDSIHGNDTVLNIPLTLMLSVTTTSFVPKNVQSQRINPYFLSLLACTPSIYQPLQLNETANTEQSHILLHGGGGPGGGFGGGFGGGGPGGPGGGFGGGGPGGHGHGFGGPGGGFGGPGGGFGGPGGGLGHGRRQGLNQPFMAMPPRAYGGSNRFGFSGSSSMFNPGPRRRYGAAPPPQYYSNRHGLCCTIV